MTCMSTHPQINGANYCEHVTYWDVCKKNPCKGVYQKWLLDKEFEEWKTENAGDGDAIDAMIFLLQKNKNIKRAEMRDDISALVARVRSL